MNTHHDPTKDPKHAEEMLDDQEGQPPVDAAHRPRPTQIMGGTDPETGLPHFLPEGYPTEGHAPLP